MKAIITIFLFTYFHSLAPAQDYISYYLIHVGIDHSLKENERQKDIKTGQAIVGVEEEINRAQTSRFNERYKRVKERLNKLALLFEGAFMGFEAYPLLNSIINTQSRIMNEVQSSPHLMPVAIQSEIEFVKKAQSIIGFLTGLVLTYGDINQMKAGDRKLLLNHAIDELRLLDGISANLLSTIRNIKLAERLKRAEIERWVNRDRGIINEIISNAKNLM